MILAPTPEQFGAIAAGLAVLVMTYAIGVRRGFRRGARRQSAIDYNRGFLRGRLTERTSPRGEEGSPQ